MAGLGSVTVSCPCCGSGITAPLTGTMLPLRSADGTAVVEVSANIDHTCPPTPERKAS